MSHPRLLIVDDNPELADNLREIFEARGFEVSFCQNASEALASAQRDPFDLALLDVNLPDLSGAELLPSLRSAVPFGEVVLVTGHATLDSAVAAVRGGAFHYVVKPFKVDDLLATAEAALRQGSLRRERAELAQRLEASERRYRDVVESTQMLVVGIDPSHRVRLLNRRAQELTGHRSEEILGSDALTSLFPPEARDAVKSRLSVQPGGRSAEEFEAVLLSRDGHRRTVLWHGVLATADREHGTGESTSVYLVGSDVTDRRALERRAAEAEALAHMGTLAAGLAHEIRNPLNAALLQLHLLGRGIERLPPEERQTLPPRVQIVGAELRRLERLLSDFLELARPRPMAREAVPLHELVEQVAAFQDPAAAERGVTLSRRLSDSTAVGDRERLKQVFHNLVVNALEATGVGGAVTLSSRREPEGMVSVTVNDNGRGISRGTMEKVFEPFFTTKEAGTGLGLAIVRQIVERHCGRVELESTEGRGTRVTVLLPEHTGR